MKYHYVLLILLWGFSSSVFARDKITVASVQYAIKGNQSFESFTQRVSEFIKKAKAKKADVIVFPEYLILDQWPLDSKESEKSVVAKISQDSSVRWIERLKEWSKKNQMVIIGGTLPRATADGKFLSSAPIVFPDGRVEYQDKIFFTPWEKELEMVRGNELRRLEYDGVSFAVLICFDVEFPRLSQLLAAKPPELLLVPSMTESEAGLRRVRYTAQARAVESHAYVVIAGTVGRTSKSWVQFGQGVFLGPQEKGFPAVLKEGKANREEMVVVELDLKKLRESREKSGYNPSREDKGEPIRMAP